MSYMYMIIHHSYVKKYVANNFSKKIVVKIGQTDQPNPMHRTNNYEKTSIIVKITKVVNSS